jgi:hypothetical protein
LEVSGASCAPNGLYLLRRSRGAGAAEPRGRKERSRGYGARLDFDAAAASKSSLAPWLASRR